MRPTRSTEAHQTADFAELVCSNSLKSESENTAPWLLKQEMRRAGSILLAEADATAVPPATPSPSTASSSPAASPPASHAEPRITVHREEVTTLDENDPDTITILATGPLTSPAARRRAPRLTGSDHLAFYDSISPIVDASTIDMDKVYFAARYDKGTADYINCPFTKEEYDRFLDALTTAEAVPEAWEQIPDGQCMSSRTRVEPDDSLKPPRPLRKLHYFEGCLPIEETARRGRDTLRFGPMKPVGLTDPKTGRWPYAVVQLRQENLRADSYNLVGFQNHLKFGEQARVLRLIPGLENATFLRYGQIHRNTYINAPIAAHRNPAAPRSPQHPDRRPALRRRRLHRIHRLAACSPAATPPRSLTDAHPQPAPRLSANGSLTHYITHAETQKIPARQHHLRPAATPRRRAPQEDPRQKRTPSTPMQPRSYGLEPMA